MKLNTIINAGFVVCFLTSFTACIESEIDITDLTVDSADISHEIVIEGGVLSIYGKQFIRLSEPSGFHDDEIRPISNAILELTDGENLFRYAELEEPGDYETIDSIKGEIGKRYVLTITHNGKIYSASDSLFANETVYGQIPINEIHLGENQRIYTISKQHNFGFDQSNIWITNQRQVSTGDFQKLNPRKIINEEQKLFSHSTALPQGLFPAGFTSIGKSGNAEDTIEFLKLSISPEYHDYLVSVFNETDWASGIFSSIRGNTSSNVSAGGTGFFYASDVQIIRKKFRDLESLVE